MTRIAMTVVVAAVFAAPAPALAWELFDSPNPAVERGNERYAEEDFEGALGAYDDAARQLPSEPGVALNRGLALLRLGQSARAREAFVQATEPPATDDVRADAYYDLGLSFFYQGDEAATASEHEQAQRHFREAADAFRRSLRARPGDRDTGWNLELALRRLQEQQQAQEEQEQQEQQEQEDEQDQEGEQDEENQEQEQGQEGEDDEQQQGDDEEQQDDSEDPQQPDQEPGDETPDDQNQPGDDEEQQAPNDEEGDRQREQEQDADDRPGDPDEGADPSQSQQPRETSREGADQDAEALPEHVARALDALQDGEENLERHRARVRGQRENRRVIRDW